VVPLIDLKKFLGGYSEVGPHGDQQADMLLEFNDRLVAFRVQGIERVFRVSWKDLMPLPKCPGMNAPVTGVILLEDRIITLLDFESIGAVLGVNGDVRLNRQGRPADTARRSERPLIYVDDSPLIRRMLDDALTEAGYGNIRGFTDGQEAWEYLAQIATDSSPGEIGERVSCVISDIEMPRMDGFHLTKRIRGNTALQSLPVVLFSSLISRDNEKKGKQVGATAQISKPRWEDLATTLTQLLDEVI
jgi:two-component system chemotaxis response regulator CheV